MKKLIIALVCLLPSLAFASGGEVHLEKAPVDLTDKASMQRGFKLFMNYCAGCHQMQYQRYQRTAEDLGIPMDMLKENLIFDGSKVGDHITNAMDPKLAAKWFGAPPPDLTLEARLRGADWIYTYLHSFYADDSRPFGVNNVVFPQVGMPHVLESLQGVPHLNHETGTIESDGRGELSDDEYDQAVTDLVNFLVYVGEPVQLERKRLGYWVLGYLFILFIFAYLLKKEYWKDVH